MHGLNLQKSDRTGYTYEELVEVAARVSHDKFIKHRNEAAEKDGLPPPVLSQDIHPHDTERGQATLDEFIKRGVMKADPTTGLFKIETPDTP